MSSHDSNNAAVSALPAWWGGATRLDFDARWLDRVATTERWVDKCMVRPELDCGHPGHTDPPGSMTLRQQLVAGMWPLEAAVEERLRARRLEHGGGVQR